MLISPETYEDLVNKLKDPSLYFEIPRDEPIYEIDLNSRKIVSFPDNLGAANDHNATLVWFMVDRFYDGIDLYKWEYDSEGNHRVGNCWVQYTNADKESYFFDAPLMVDAERFGSDKILIPWLVSHHVAKKAGAVEFSFQFFATYKVGEQTKFRYVINTQSAKSKILTATWADPLGEIKNEDTYTLIAKDLADLRAEINKYVANYQTYWLTVE